MCESRTELDLHANMAVIGRNAAIVAETGKTVNIKPFSSECNELVEVPIVDAVVKWVCPNTATSYLLLLRNALYVKSMTNNLVPPFILREAGLVVKDTPKIHMTNPERSDHSIYIPDKDLRITLSLRGVFSYFPTCKPTDEELEGTEEIIPITPVHWNPHSDVYAQNEHNMVDHEGNMIEEHQRIRILLSEIQDDLNNDHMISSIVAKSIDEILTRLNH